VTPYNLLNCYKCFGVICCLHLQGSFTMTIGTTDSSETLVTTYQTTRFCNPESKCSILGVKDEVQHAYKTTGKIVGFEVFTAVVMKSTIFWDITPCNPLEVNPRFGETYRLHLQGRRVRQARNQSEIRWPTEPEDGRGIFLRNAGRLSTNYKALCPRKQNSSTCKIICKF
jgi:hypothetical protein